MAVHAGMDGRPWWATLAVTAAAGLAAYLALVMPALPAHERAAVRARLHAVDRRAP